MATRSRAARGVACAAAVLALVVLTACGSASDPSTSAPSGGTASAAFETLPDSVLPEQSGVTYVESDASRAALARTHVGTTLSAFTGGIARELQVDGRPVAVVQVYRFASDIALADRERFLPMLVFVDTSVGPTAAPLGGKKVQVVSEVPGQRRAVVAWVAGDQAVLLSASDLTVAREQAGAWILSSF